MRSLEGVRVCGATESDLSITVGRRAEPKTREDDPWQAWHLLV